MRPPESWERARVTLAIAAVTAAAWLLPWLAGYSDAAAVHGGFIPARLTLDPGAPLGWLTPLTATLVHGGLLHLAFNALILLFCGRSVETILGAGGLIALYVIGAYAAAALHYVVQPASTIPIVGASGAISAVIGAYAMLFGRNRVKVRNGTLAIWLNALWLAAGWIGLQLLIGVTFETQGARIAIAAHIGGFLAGLLLAKPLLLWRYRRA